MAVGAVSPFIPDAQGAGVSLTAGTTSASVALPASPGETLYLLNSGAVPVFVALAPTATLAGTPIPPGATMLMQAGRYAQTLSAITGSSTAVLYVQRGAGSAR